MTYLVHGLAAIVVMGMGYAIGYFFGWIKGSDQVWAHHHELVDSIETVTFKEGSHYALARNRMLSGKGFLH